MKTYEPSEKDKKNIKNNFTYHAPKVELEQTARYEVIRNESKDLAKVMTELCPPSRELSLALTNLEQAVMWANAAIARNE